MDIIVRYKDRRAKDWALTVNNVRVIRPNHEIATFLGTQKEASLSREIDF
jgi:hypothetical protein